MVQVVMIADYGFIGLITDADLRGLVAWHS
ncbi:MAG: hypothetical protein ACI8RD_008067 [Bacillariaceae sp.]|jgi:hypothetical protein